MSKVKSYRVNVTDTPRVWDALIYKADWEFWLKEIPEVSDAKITVYQWWAKKWEFTLNQAWEYSLILESEAAHGWGDVLYTDFTFITQSWSNVDLSLNTKIVPISDFTINAPADLKEWWVYVLRVINWPTQYTMSLWSTVTNPMWVDLDLTANGTDIFVFMAVDWVLELQQGIKAMAAVAYSGNYADLVNKPIVVLNITQQGWQFVSPMSAQALHALTLWDTFVILKYGKIMCYPSIGNWDDTSTFVFSSVGNYGQDILLRIATFIVTNTTAGNWYLVNWYIDTPSLGAQDIVWLAPIWLSWLLDDAYDKPIILTRAEWQALPDTKYSDNRFYLIKKSN